MHELLNGVIHPTSRHGFSGIEVDNFRMLVDHCRTEGVSQPFMFSGYYRRFAKHLSKFSFIWVEVGNEVGHISNSTNDVIRAKGRTFIMRAAAPVAGIPTAIELLPLFQFIRQALSQT